MLKNNNERNTVPASGKLTVRGRPFNGTRWAARASAGYQGQGNFCYFGKLLTFVGINNFQLSPDNHLKRVERIKVICLLEYLSHLRDCSLIYKL